MKLLEKEITLKLIQGESVTILDKITLLRVEEDLKIIKQNSIEVLKQIRETKKSK